MSNLTPLTWGRDKAGALPCRKLVITADGISCIFWSIGHILSCILWEKRVFSASLLSASTVPLLRGMEKQWEILNGVLWAPYRLDGQEGETGGEMDFLWNKNNKIALIDGQNRSSEFSQRPRRGQFLLGIFKMIKNKTAITGRLELIPSC